MKYDFNELEITVPYDVHFQGLTPLEQPRTEKTQTHKQNNLQLCRIEESHLLTFSEQPQT